MSKKWHSGSSSLPAITAFVEATAGIIRFTTPVKKQNIYSFVFFQNYRERLFLARIITEGCIQRYFKHFPGISILIKYNGRLLKYFGILFILVNKL